MVLLVPFWIQTSTMTKLVHHLTVEMNVPRTRRKRSIGLRIYLLRDLWRHQLLSFWGFKVEGEGAGTAASSILAQQCSTCVTPKAELSRFGWPHTPVPSSAGDNDLTSQ